MSPSVPPVVASRIPGAVSSAPPWDAVTLSPGGNEPPIRQEPRLIVSETANAIGEMGWPCCTVAGLGTEAIRLVAPASECTAPSDANVATTDFKIAATGAVAA